MHEKELLLYSPACQFLSFILPCHHLQLMDKQSLYISKNIDSSVFFLEAICSEMFDVLFTTINLVLELILEQALPILKTVFSANPPKQETFNKKKGT